MATCTKCGGSVPDSALVCPRCAAPMPRSSDAAIPKTVFEGDAQAALGMMLGGAPPLAADDAGMARTMLAEPTPAPPPATGGGFAAQGTPPAVGAFGGPGTPPSVGGFAAQGTPPAGGFGGQPGQWGLAAQGTPPAQGSWGGAAAPAGAPGFAPQWTPPPGGMAAGPAAGPGGAPPRKSSGCRTAAIIGGIVAGVFLIILVVGGVLLCSVLRGSGGGALAVGQTEQGTITAMTPETDGAPAIDYTLEVESAGWYRIDLTGEASYYSFAPVLVVLRDGAEVGRAAASQTVETTTATLSLPLQPGEHSVRVTTDGSGVEGRVTFRLTVSAAGAGAGTGPTGMPVGSCARMAACCQAIGPLPDFSGTCASVPYFQSQPNGEATCQQQLPALQASIRARGWQLPYDCQ